MFVGVGVDVVGMHEHAILNDLLCDIGSNDVFISLLDVADIFIFGISGLTLEWFSSY